MQTTSWPIRIASLFIGSFLLLACVPGGGGGDAGQPQLDGPVTVLDQQRSPSGTLIAIHYLAQTGGAAGSRHTDVWVGSPVEWFGPDLDLRAVMNEQWWDYLCDVRLEWDDESLVVTYGESAEYTDDPFYGSDLAATPAAINGVPVEYRKLDVCTGN